MRHRTSPKNKGMRHLYYDKGIRICPAWDEFEVFYKWAIENGFKNELVLDRRDGNKDYCPGNCRWVTFSQNAQNKSKPKKLYKKSISLPLNKDNHKYVYSNTNRFIRKTNGRFIAEMIHDGNCLHIGEYDSKEQALAQLLMN